jgi:WD40 repeat protein
MWLVDLRTSQKTPIPVPSQYVTAVAFSPDGETLYGAVPGGLIYMFPTALPDRPAARMQMGVGADPDIWTLAASPDGVHLAVGRRSGLLEIWNVGARSMVAQKQFTIEEMGALRFSDDGRALIAFFRRDPVSYRIVHANDLEQLDFGGNQPVSLRGNNYAGDVISETAMALSGNLIYAPFRRKLLGGEFDGVAEIMLSELPGGPSPSNGAVAGDRDVPHDNSGAAQRDTRALPLERPGMRVAARLGWTDTLGQPHATCLELSPDGERLAVADQTGRLSLWSLESGAMLSDYDLSMGPVMDMAYLSDSSLGVIDASGRVRIIDLSARPDRVWWTPPDGAADDLWLSPDWTRMATRRDAPVQIQDAPAGERVVAPVRVWDLPSGDSVATLNDVDPDARFVLSPGGTRLAALAYRDLLLFDLTDAPDVPDPVRVTADRSGSIDAKAFSDDGRIFSMAGGSRMAGHVAAFDTETGERILNADYHRAGIGERILFSDDGKALGVTGGRGDSVTWFALDGSNAQLDKGYPVADDNPVRDFLVNLASGYPGGERGVLAPDNRRLAVLHNGAVDIYDTATGTVLATLRDRFGALVAMHYPDPGTLHAVTDEGRIGTWNLSALAKGTAFDVACRLLRDPSLEDALRGYPIIQEDPICGPDYAPPLPAWMDLSHAAIGYTP